MGNGNGHNGTYTAEQFIKAIPGTAGIISKIAERIGCAWHTAKKYINKMPTVQRAYQDECDTVLDMAESKLLKAIENDDHIMIRYYLSTKGKHRGYTERKEVTGADAGPIQTVTRLNVGQFSDDELNALATIAGRIAPDTPGTGEA